MTPRFDRPSWVERELAPWRGYDGPIATPHDTTFIFHLEDGRIRADGDVASLPPVFETRLALHVGFLEAAVARFAFDRNLSFAVDLGDLAADRSYPCFSFQKNRGAGLILFPDRIIDPPPSVVDIPYENKANRAVFVGSTTGHGLLTLETFEDCPRVKAAAAFAGRDDVEFRLPSRVQCTPDVLAATHDDPRFGGGFATYEEQLRSRFLISIDGNGATCSRMTVGLRSNSAVLKYRSPYQLFYFGGLEPWQHFIPIGAHAEVIATVARERDAPMLHADIARAGSRFADRFLSEAAVHAYTVDLLEAYSEVVRTTGPASCRGRE